MQSTLIDCVVSRTSSQQRLIDFDWRYCLTLERKVTVNLIKSARKLIFRMVATGDTGSLGVARSTELHREVLVLQSLRNMGNRIIAA